MRRLITALLTVMLVSGASVTNARPRGDSPKVWGGSYQVAEAIWIVRDRGGLHMVMVFVENFSGPKPKPGTLLLLGKGPCRSKPGRSPRHASCSVSLRFKRIDAASFEIDPSLSGARLSLPGARVRWTDAGTFEPDHSVFLDQLFLDVEAEVYRPTRAAGRVHGTRMRARDQLSSALYQGVFTGWDPYNRRPDRIRVRIPF